jgi:hypothetical protein
MMRILWIALCALVLAAPAFAKPVKDNMGRVVDPDTEGGSIFFGVASETDVGDAILGYTPEMFDLEFMLGADGDDDADGTTETMVLGASLKWFPTTWMKFGPGFRYTDASKSLVDFGLPMVFYIFPRPFTSMKPYIALDPIHYTVAADGSPLSGHFSFIADANFGVEFPMDEFALAFDLGPQYLFTVLNESVNDFGGWDAAAKVVYRIR